MRTEIEIRTAAAQLRQRIHQLHLERNIPGRSEALRSSAAIEASMASSMLSGLEFALGNLPDVAMHPKARG